MTESLRSHYKAMVSNDPAWNNSKLGASKIPVRNIERSQDVWIAESLIKPLKS